jgi:hypothetical protein
VRVAYFEGQIDHKLVEVRVYVSFLIFPESLKHIFTIEKADIHSNGKR